MTDTNKLMDDWIDEDIFAPVSTFVQPDPSKRGGPDPIEQAAEDMFTSTMDGLTGLLEILDSSSIEELLTGEKEGPEVDEVGVGGVLRPILKYLKSGLKKVAKGSKKISLKTLNRDYRKEVAQFKRIKKELPSMVFWRGVDKWHPSTMVRGGKFIGGPNPKPTKVSLLYKPEKGALFVTQDKSYAMRFADVGGKEGVLLKFHIPRSVIKDTNKFTTIKDYYYRPSSFLPPKPFHSTSSQKVFAKKIAEDMRGKFDIGFFNKGLSKKYLVNVEKYIPENMVIK